eukprot:GHVQ01007539.1.p1 GENE.GHVQ01007539.1~~GHVQ01007539.1.p1  ORF type:complete len:436 (+),score=79.49 GHVQ01007539.1:191-1498(+)
MTVTKLLPFNSQSPRGNCCRARLLLHSSIGLSLLLLLTANSSYSANAVGASCQATDPTSVDCSRQDLRLRASRHLPDPATTRAAPGITKSPLLQQAVENRGLTVSGLWVSIGKKMTRFLMFRALPTISFVAAIRALEYRVNKSLGKRMGKRLVLYFMMSCLLLMLHILVAPKTITKAATEFAGNLSMFLCLDLLFTKARGGNPTQAVMKRIVEPLLQKLLEEVPQHGGGNPLSQTDTLDEDTLAELMKDCPTFLIPQGPESHHASLCDEDDEDDGDVFYPGLAAAYGSCQVAGGAPGVSMMEKLRNMEKTLPRGSHSDVLTDHAVATAEPTVAADSDSSGATTGGGGATIGGGGGGGGDSRRNKKFPNHTKLPKGFTLVEVNTNQDPNNIEGHIPANVMAFFNQKIANIDAQNAADGNPKPKKKKKKKRSKDKTS